MLELKPCPFCGGAAILDYCFGGRPPVSFVKIKCKTCGCATKIFPLEDRHGNKIAGEEMAHDAWNRRVDDE